MTQTPQFGRGNYPGSPENQKVNSPDSLFTFGERAKKIKKKDFQTHCNTRFNLKTFFVKKDRKENKIKIVKPQLKKIRRQSPITKDVDFIQQPKINHYEFLNKVMSPQKQRIYNTRENKRIQFLLQ